jgi:hypothetical protein
VRNSVKPIPLFLMAVKSKNKSMSRQFATAFSRDFIAQQSDLLVEARVDFYEHRHLMYSFW